MDAGAEIADPGEDRALGGGEKWLCRGNKAIDAGKVDVAGLASLVGFPSGRGEAVEEVESDKSRVFRVDIKPLTVGSLEDGCGRR